MYNLYSERNQEKKDIIWEYEKLPKTFIQQIKFILEDFANNMKHSDRDIFYYKIHRIYCYEKGLENLKGFVLGGGNDKIAIEEFLSDKNTKIENFFDILELSLMISKKIFYSYYDSYIHYRKFFDNKKEEINIRFKESKLGYEVIDNKIIRIDSQYTHINIIKPTINLTTKLKYQQVNSEYMDAILCYQKEDYEQSILKAVESFESLLKIICDENNWNYSNSDGYERLIDICYENNFLEDFIINEFKSLRGLLKSMSAVRNKFTSHGKGNSPKDIPTYLVKHVLNVIGSCILFVIESQDYKV